MAMKSTLQLSATIFYSLGVAINRPCLTLLNEALHQLIVLLCGLVFLPPCAIRNLAPECSTLHNALLLPSLLQSTMDLG